MLSIFTQRGLSLFIALFLWGSVTTLETDPLYATCPVWPTESERELPQEADGTDLAFAARETVRPEYADSEALIRRGFTHIVGMWNIVTVFPCDRGMPARVEWRSLKLVAEDKRTGDTTVVQTLYFDTDFDTADAASEAPHLESAEYQRTPWFTSGLARIQPMVARETEGTYTVDVQALPKGIVHGWTTPRVLAEPGKRYRLEATVRITGDARLQLGMDYWKGESSAYNGWSQGCTTSNNCEAWLSDWIGDTGGEFVTWRVPVLAVPTE